MIHLATGPVLVPIDIQSKPNMCVFGGAQSFEELQALGLVPL